MSNFVKRGEKFFPVAEQALHVESKLPVGTYSLKFDPDQGYFFQQIEQFVLPSKVYGDLSRNANRIISTFLDRDNSTGVLLAGEKGSGKTLLAKKLSSDLANEHGIITIVIASAFAGESFNTLIQGIQQPAMLLFDEFEKTYPTDGPSGNQQEALLTLLDGVYPTKKLFVLTTNERYRIDSHMQNRPGRLFYSIEYNGLDQEFVREYAEDNLINKDHVQSVVNVSALFYRFNFDMLKAIVEEMNRYNESAKEALRLLNARPEGNGSNDYNVQLIIDEKEVAASNLDSPVAHVSPLSMSDLEIHYFPRGRDEYQLAYEKWKTESGGRGVFEEIETFFTNKTFSSEHLIKVDGSTNSFTFKNEDGDVLILTKRPVYSHDYYYGI